MIYQFPLTVVKGALTEAYRVVGECGGNTIFTQRLVVYTKDASGKILSRREQEIARCHNPPGPGGH